MLRKIPAVILTAVFFATSVAFAQSPRKILNDSAPAIVSQLTPIGDYPKTNRLHLAIGLPLRNQTQLDELLRQIYDPAGTNFHKYLAPQEFATRFGAAEADYQAVKNFAAANGLTVTCEYGNRIVLDVEGNVANVERAFQTRLRIYQHPTEARTFYAPDILPSVPANLPVLSVSGLDNFSLPHPKNLVLQNDTGIASKSGSGPSGTYAGNDFRAAYVPGVTLDGSGQSVALLEFDGYFSNDIASYEQSFGLPAVSLTNVLVDGGVGSPGSGNSEVALDIEMAIAMAPGLSKVIVYEAPNPSPWPDIIGRIADDNSARQISCSWGGGAPDATSEQLFKQMAAQGQSFFNASGDSDAFVGSIPFPSDSTNITQVGGTTLTTSGPGGTWSSETVWNWGRVHGKFTGSSGGISTVYAISDWQKGIAMTSNHGSTAMRNVPDVALTADNIYVKYNSGGSGNFGGTSCAAPLWAAFTALVNQQNAAMSRPPAGFVNPTVYSIGKSANYAADFHDITTGNNFWNSSPTNFPAVAGYDLCTGWGTPNGSNLIMALAGAVVSNPPPVADFTGSPTNGFYPLTVNFTNLSSNAASYSWNFGDGQNSTSTNPSHVYTNAGNFSVTLTATGAGGINVLALANYIVVTNTPPVLSPISDETILETTPLIFTNMASDADDDVLTFSLDAGAPTNAMIDTAAGIFSWMPTEAQGPSTNLITVRITDSGSPPLSATQNFTVIVLESNLPPVLAPIADRTIHVGTTLTITNSATDPDIPANALTFNLSTFNIKTATINSTNGIFTWTPDSSFVNTTDNFTVIVTDFNPWAVNNQHLSDSRTFHVIVEPPPSFLTSQPPVTFSNGAVTISWGAISGQTYRVQYNGNLNSTDWIDLLPDVTATNSTASKTDLIDASSNRFYRVFPLP